ncbi:hypothetical protein RUM44_011462 [Polyplax serrata]|uniref:Uncharacterized protein n=1 Tax=Polyplax serrata TaxID=468196 RepID=A0ABR1AQ42_POLSC
MSGRPGNRSKNVTSARCSLFAEQQSRVVKCPERRDAEESFDDVEEQVNCFEEQDVDMIVFDVDSFSSPPVCAAETTRLALIVGYGR